jgi:hypothetical protein
MKNLTVQDIINSDIFEKNTNTTSDMVELLEFVRVNATPLTNNQVEAMFLLNEFGLEDIARYMNNVRPFVTPKKNYYDMVSKITLADRIKGTAKLKDIMKSQVPSTEQVPNPNEFKAKPMRESELR